MSGQSVKGSPPHGSDRHVPALLPSLILAASQLVAMLKEHPEKGVYVKGLSMHTVHSVAQCEHIMEAGWKNRSVGYTLMNKDSSRSHSIFTISIEISAVGR
ncbi:Kinesin-like protein kif17 [Saguinus oedipus]|uniref:Kinesin-like protein kif17 n=1 Tax=Saguinus oedipus TaxID=9490 RepID=A0ABQ9VCM5_SAGOE|nr:Kinesin-like protein kif17 [Saguinus oedipus]